MEKYNTFNSVIIFNEESRELETKAITHKELSHYTNCKALATILKTMKIKADCLKDLPDLSERNAVNDKVYSNAIFEFSFTYNKKDNEQMWINFGDNHKGVKTKFVFKNSVKDFINYKQPIEAYNDKGKLYHFLMVNGIKYKDIKEYYKENVLVDLKFKDIKYSEKEKLKNESIIHFKKNKNTKTSSKFVKNILQNGMALELNSAGAIVKNKYYFQKETRIILIMMTEEELEHISYLLVPIKLDGVDRIIITFGNKCSKDDIREIQEITKNIDTKFEFNIEQGG